MDSHSNFAMTCYLNVRYLNVVVANPVVNKTKGKKKKKKKKEWILKKQSGLIPNHTFSSFKMIY